MPLLEVCLVSDYPLIDYLGCNLKKPDAVVWLYNHTHKSMIAPIEKKLESQNNIQFEKRETKSDDIQAFLSDCEQIIKDYPEHDILLNVSGGTRLQALLATKVFRDADQDVFYIDPEHSQVIDIRSNEAKTFHFNLTVNEYIALHGIKMESGTRFDPEIGKRSALSYFIGNNIYRLIPFIDKMREEWTAMGDEKSAKQWRFTRDYIKFTVNYDPEKNIMKFSYGTDEWQRTTELEKIGAEYLFRGGWLRELVFLRVHKSQYDDVRLDVRLDRDSLPPGERSESMVDIAMRKRCKFYIFQCFSFPISKDSFIELKSIHHTIELLNAIGFVIMAHKPHQGFIDRAHSAGIKVVYGKRISNFSI